MKNEIDWSIRWIPVTGNWLAKTFFFSSRLNNSRYIYWLFSCQWVSGKYQGYRLIIESSYISAIKSFEWTFLTLKLIQIATDYSITKQLEKREVDSNWSKTADLRHKVSTVFVHSTPIASIKYGNRMKLDCDSSVKKAKGGESAEAFTASGAH